ncbi:hypothetical protein EP331_14140 [bacterium]|nr:MAG: hypothetical protein EP331_14140 [bacterium]
MKEVSRISLVMFVLNMLLLTNVSEVFAQVSINHTQPTVLEKTNQATLEFEILGINLQDIQDAFLNYRFDGGIAYQSAKADIERGKVVVTFDTNVETANQVQYYLVVNLVNDEKFLYPANAESDDSPINVTLVDPKDVSNDLSGSDGVVDFTILSPLPNEEIVPEDALVALTLFYNEGSASSDSIKILFDGVDVTGSADVTPYLITYVPQNLLPGNHSVEVTYTYNGKSTSLTKWDFPTLDPNSKKAQAKRSGKKYAAGQVELSARNQSIFGTTDDIYKSTFRVGGSAGWFKYNLNGMFTSQENSRLQPQHRYGIEMYAGNIFELQAGHIFPKMNPLMLAGNRVYGVNTALHLFDRLINAQVTIGEMRRSVSNLYSNVRDTSIVLATNLDGSAQTEDKYALNFQNQGTGTFRRQVLGGRFALGNGDVFQMGFNAMKVVDRESSINVIENYDDLIALQPELLNSLDATQKADLAANPDKFLAPNSSTKPRDNFMFAGDLTIRGFSGKMALRSDYGMSLLNNDISSGVLNKARAEELNLSIPDDIANVLDEISWLIIVNENMSYLPLSFTTDDNGDTSVDVLKTRFLFFNDTPVPTALMASQNSLNLNFLGNNFQARYQWVGPEYQTLANTALRRDIAGYAFSDRFRLLSNTIYVTMGFERFQDNLIGSKESTTQTQIINGDVSWYPVSKNLPRLSVGYRLQTRDNGIKRLNPYLNGDNLLAAIRNVQVIDGNETIIATPRNDVSNQITFSISKELEFLGLRNDFTLNYMNLVTTDDVYAFGDFSSDVYSFGIITNWAILPMRTNVNVTLNNSNGSSGLAKVDILGVNLGASYFLFNEKLNVFADFALTTNTIKTIGLDVSDNGTTENLLDDYYFRDLANQTSSDQNTYILRGGATYNFNEHHALLFDASFTNVQVNTGISVPNDRVVQLRYVYRF